MIRTAESVTKYHPDKICDQISDAILDACLIEDPMSRVAIETMGGHGLITLTGELTTRAEVVPYHVAKKIYKDLTGKNIRIKSNIVQQCPEISKGVNKGGAGDQGIMIGYACTETETKLPKEFHLAREMLKPFHKDGKSQVTLDMGVPTEIVLSVQGMKRRELAGYVMDFLRGEALLEEDIEVNTYCNNTGSFEIGGFDADTGVTGRKIVVDAYGPRVPVGGGAFSGKDPTKVDRSAAYMARYIALDLLNTLGAEEVLVKLGYVIGKAQPIMAQAIIDGHQEQYVDDYDCRPEAIIERFDLRKPIYLETARNGHFGIASYPWEKI